jgi:hypothetical protein
LIPPRQIPLHVIPSGLGPGFSVAGLGPPLRRQNIRPVGFHLSNIGIRLGFSTSGVLVPAGLGIFTRQYGARSPGALVRTTAGGVAIPGIPPTLSLSSIDRSASSGLDRSRNRAATSYVGTGPVAFRYPAPLVAGTLPFPGHIIAAAIVILEHVARTRAVGSHDDHVATAVVAIGVVVMIIVDDDAKTAAGIMVRVPV